MGSCQANSPRNRKPESLQHETFFKAAPGCSFSTTGSVSFKIMGGAALEPEGVKTAFAVGGGAELKSENMLDYVI